ncbi:MAG: DUF4145 domain-containing protein [Hyphomicrobiales bacterium]|nr:DUF4145 domain-containing protein [Hyphomicrobiales bacterium]
MARMKVPALGAESFSCPHCGAFSAQEWFRCYAQEASFPPQPEDEQANQLAIYRMESMDDRNAAREQLSKLMAGYVWFGPQSGGSRVSVENLSLSRCCSCKEFAVWLYDKLIFPRTTLTTMPHDDMPEDVAHDFSEAAGIVSVSPRGAAALLRLAIQKLCRHLGEDSENLNKNIGNLAAKGLSPIVQKGLDIVRVIGNNAVHPGQIDLNDDRSVAYSLFEFVNLIVEN